MKIIICIVGVLALLLVSCTNNQINQPLNNDSTIDSRYYGSIKNTANCYSLYLAFSENTYNLTYKERQMYLLGSLQRTYFPLNLSFGDACNPDGIIPDKIYKTAFEIPLEDDCYDRNKTRCWVKWVIGGD
jgi:hypothetical protein